jgi:hypothetical protein
LCNRKHGATQQQDIFQVTRETGTRKISRTATRAEQVAVRLKVPHSRFLRALILIGLPVSLAGTRIDEQIIVAGWPGSTDGCT